MEKIIVNEKNAGLFFTQHGSHNLRLLLTAWILRVHEENAEKLKSSILCKIEAISQKLVAEYRRVHAESRGGVQEHFNPGHTDKRKLFCPYRQYSILM